MHGFEQKIKRKNQLNVRKTLINLEKNNRESSNERTDNASPIPKIKGKTVRKTEGDGMLFST